MLNQKNDVSINYDKKNDILYISLGEPLPSYGDEKYDGIVFRYSFIDERLTGFTILDFKKRLSEDYFSSIDFLVNLDFEKIEEHIN